MEKPVAAISTAIGRGGIAIVRMSGNSCSDIAASVFRRVGGRDWIEKENRKLYYGHIYDGEQLIDEVMIVYLKAPNTYTREDMVEIYTHGGTVPASRVYSLLLKKGADPAGPGEFTKRAFLNGRLDLSQAEAVSDLVSAKTDRTYDASLRQLEGSLSGRIHTLREEILQILAHLEYMINFTEDGQEELDVEDVLVEGRKVFEKMKALRDTKNKGKILREGVSTVILGKPNVGKSSLMNSLLKENRAIVTDIPGTTRDVIEEQLNLGGIALKIRDTAGIRHSEDPVEKIGVDRSLATAMEADLRIGVFDISRPLDEEDEKIISLLKEGNAVCLLNKSDLPQRFDVERLAEELPGVLLLHTSMLRGEGVAELEEAIVSMFYCGDLAAEDTPILTNLRHEQLVSQACDHLEQFLEDGAAGIPIDCVEVDLRRAWELLGEITGETVEDDVLDKIFREFCVGK